MALLDEAIREHLDLKRRRGADPAEIERLEREALGRVRRAPDEADFSFEDPSLASDDPSLASDEPSVASEERPVAFDQEAEETRLLPSQEQEASSEAQALPELSPEPAPEPPPAHRPVPAPEPTPEPPARNQGEHVDVETAEYDVEAEELVEPEHTEPPRAGDMLEETPEFLQDAPDHDRLWFEQRPPRDFDFDG
jgi:hypothetical protein